MHGDQALNINAQDCFDKISLVTIDRVLHDIETSAIGIVKKIFCGTKEMLSEE
jgi:hypothetical protein